MPVSIPLLRAWRSELKYQISRTPQVLQSKCWKSKDLTGKSVLDERPCVSSLPSFLPKQVFIWNTENICFLSFPSGINVTVLSALSEK